MPGVSAACPVCVVGDELRAQGESVAVPSFRHPPRAETVRYWTGSSLAAEPPDPRSYVRCRPCDCAASGRIEPWDDWQRINRRAYDRLREARAPYPVAIVPGFHGGGPVANYRMRMALRLLRHGWVAALIVSGGHRRSSHNEARYLYEEAGRPAAAESVDATDRIFIEPCACRTVTNLRNSLRMMAAFGLRAGLLVTESKMSAQSAVFSSDLDGLVRRDLGCAVGRVSHLWGSTPLNRVFSPDNGCRAQISLRNNPILFLLPTREPVVFWVSPVTPIAGRTLSALDCRGGNAEMRACEPDDEDPFLASCRPALGAESLGCGAASP